jgi:NADPH:quinone reductase-like Zn-dependent oxidoreductase
MAKEQDKRVDALLDSLLEGRQSEEILGKAGLLGELTKRLVERALEAEMTTHLGYEKHAADGRNRKNSRNGRTAKRVKTDTSEVEIEVPRDREGTFEPQLVPKRRRRLAGFDDKVLALYTRGRSTRVTQEAPEGALRGRRLADSGPRKTARATRLSRPFVHFAARAAAKCTSCTVAGPPMSNLPRNPRQIARTGLAGGTRVQIASRAVLVVPPPAVPPPPTPAPARFFSTRARARARPPFPPFPPARRFASPIPRPRLRSGVCRGGGGTVSGMRAAIFHEHGGPEVVRVEEVATPEPGAGDVRVRVAAAALNHLDLWVRRGLPIETTMPHIGGSDIAGVVDSVGAGVEGWEAGARVVVNPSLGCGRCAACAEGETPLCPEYRIIGEHTQGGFAEHVTVPASNLLRVPDEMPFPEAAAAALAFLTAWRGLTTRGGVREDEHVLVTGASGGVGTAAVQIARLCGARVYALTSEPHVERVRELGADVVYDRTADDFGRALWLDTEKRGVDVIFDSVGAPLFPTLVRSLARGGRLVVYGGTAGAKVDLDVRQLFWKQADIRGTTMSSRAEFEEVMRLVFAGRLHAVIDEVLPLDAARLAHERLEAGGVFGKIVLQP